MSSVRERRMHKDNGRYYYSPSDLNEFLASPFATWMSRYALDFPDLAQPDPEPLSLTTLAERARKHEQTCLAQLRQEGREVHTLPADADRVEATITAMRAGHEVIYHGRLCEAAFPPPPGPSPGGRGEKPSIFSVGPTFWCGLRDRPLWAIMATKCGMSPSPPSRARPR